MGDRRILGFALAALLLAGCGQQDVAVTQPTATPFVSAQRQAACRKALLADYTKGWQSDAAWPPSSYRPVCATIDEATLLQLMDQALDDILGRPWGPSTRTP